jgi:hypothetical protein
VSEVPRVALKVQLEADTARDPVALEEAIAAEGRRAARELFARVIEEADRRLVAASGGTRKRLEPRWVATLVGRFRIHRYRVKLGEETFHPLDRAMGWERGEASPALRKLVLRFAKKLPFREVAQVVSDRIGEPFSYQNVRRILRNDRSTSGTPRGGRHRRG